MFIPTAAISMNTRMGSRIFCRPMTVVMTFPCLSPLVTPRMVLDHAGRPRS
jgi:hypothetical protein